MTVPSPEVLNERLNNMISQNNKDHKLLFNKVDWIEDKLDNLINKLDKKFANKRVEWVVKWFIWLILSWVIGAILKMVLVK